MACLETFGQRGTRCSAAGEHVALEVTVDTHRYVCFACNTLVFVMVLKFGVRGLGFIA